MSPLSAPKPGFRMQVYNNVSPIDVSGKYIHGRFLPQMTIHLVDRNYFQCCIIGTAVDFRQLLQFIIQMSGMCDISHSVGCVYVCVCVTQFSNVFHSHCLTASDGCKKMQYVSPKMRFQSKVDQMQFFSETTILTSTRHCANQCKNVPLSLALFTFPKRIICRMAVNICKHENNQVLQSFITKISLFNRV